MDSFQIRPYRVGELASLYMPDVKPKSAVRTFRRWIVRSPGLVERLRETGWEPHFRIFTPAQVRLIVAALDEP